MKTNLQKLQDRLKEQYKRDVQIKRLFYPDDPFPLAECFLELALVEEKILKESKKTNVNENSRADEEEDPGPGGYDGWNRFKEKEAKSNLFLGREYFLHEYERINYIQQRIEVSKLLQTCATSKKRLYIEGAAGSGKSTLIRHIALAWANNQTPWNKYEWVFYIRLRDLMDPCYASPGIKSVDILERMCFGYDGDLFQLSPADRDDLRDRMQTSPDSVLFLLDGYDEIDLQQTAIKEAWKSFTQTDFHLLLTSRPNTILSKVDLHIQSHIAVLGFGEVQVEKYINYFFSPEHAPDTSIQDAKDCLEWLQRNPNIWSIAHVPIQLELLCSSWKDIKHQENINLTLLYETLWKNLLKRLTVKQGQALAYFDIKAVEHAQRLQCEYLERLAFLGMQSQRILLTESELELAYSFLQPPPDKRKDFYEAINVLGFVKYSNHNQQAEFVHLTFQEFFAARYVAAGIEAFYQKKPHTLEPKDLVTFINQTKFQPFYEIMWRFLVGLLLKSSTAQTLIPFFFDLLLSAPRLKLVVQELPLLISCWAETNMHAIPQGEVLQNTAKAWLEMYWRNGQVRAKGSTSNPLQRLWQISSAQTNLVELWLEKQLIRGMQDQDDNVKRAAIWAIGQLGIVTPLLQQELLRLLKQELLKGQHARRVDPNSNCSSLIEPILQTVSQIGIATALDLQQAVVSLLSENNLGSFNWGTRRATGKAISKLGEAAISEFEKFLPCLLNSKSYMVRDTTAQAIGELGCNVTQPLQDGLLQLLSDRNSEAREGAAWAAGRLGATARSNLQKKLLNLFLQDKDGLMRRVAAKSLGQIATTKPELQKILFNLLKHDDNFTRELAARAIGWIVGAAIQPELLQQLPKVLEDKNPQVRESTVLAVSRIGKTLTLNFPLQQKLFQLLEDEKWYVRVAAAKSIQIVGFIEPRLIEELVSKGKLFLRLQDERLEVRLAVLPLIGKIRDANSLLKLQQKLLELQLKYQDDAEWCKAAVKIIGQLGPTANFELQTAFLSTALKHASISGYGQLEVRKTIAQTVGQLNITRAPALQQILLSLLQDNEERVQKAAMKTVCKLEVSTTLDLEKMVLAILLPKNTLFDQQWITDTTHVINDLGIGSRLSHKQSQNNKFGEISYIFELLDVTTNSALQTELLGYLLVKNQYMFQSLKASCMIETPEQQALGRLIQAFFGKTLETYSPSEEQDFKITYEELHLASALVISSTPVSKQEELFMPPKQLTAVVSGETSSGSLTLFSIEQLSQLSSADLQTLYLEKGLAANTDEDYRLLHQVATYQNITALQELIKPSDNSYLTEETDSNDNTPVHVAMLLGRTELLSFFTENRIDLHKENQWGLQPLHYALATNDMASLSYFINDLGDGATERLTMTTSLKYGSDLSLSYDLTYTSWAFFCSDVSTIKHVLKTVNPEEHPQILRVPRFGTLVHLAVWRDSVELLNSLLAYKSARDQLNTLDEGGRTPLSLAAQLGRLSAMQCLLARSEVKQNLPSGANQWTPLHWAIEGFQVESVAMLLHNVDPNKPAKENVVPLEFLHRKQDPLKNLPKDKRTQEQKNALKIYNNIETELGKGYRTNPYQGTVRRFESAKQRRYTNLVINGGGAKGMLFPFALESLQAELKAGQSLDKRADFSFLNGIRRVAGTSAGSITALFIALGCTTEQIKKLLLGEDVALKAATEEVFTLLHLDIEQLVEGKLDTALPQNAPLPDETAWSFRKLFEKIKGSGYAAAQWATDTTQTGARYFGNAWNMSFHQGLVKGDNFLNWLEHNIAAKLQAEGVYDAQKKRDGLITFREWQKLINEYPTKNFKHLYITITQLSPSIKPITLDTEFLGEYDWYADMPIADAVRASMSIPLVFQPYVPRQRLGNGEMAALSDYLFVDGGSLLNYPLHLFDKAYYREHALRDSSKWDVGKMTYVNHNTLGLCLVPSTDLTVSNSSPITTKDLIMAIGSLYWNNELLTQYREADDAPRTVFLECKIEMEDGEVLEIGTLDFAKTQDEKYLIAAQQSSEGGVRSFLNGDNKKDAETLREEKGKQKEAHKPEKKPGEDLFPQN